MSDHYAIAYRRARELGYSKQIAKALARTAQQDALPGESPHRTAERIVAVPEYIHVPVEQKPGAE